MRVPARLANLLAVPTLLAVTLALATAGAAGDPPSAREMILRAIEALGGAEAVQAGATIEFTQRGVVRSAEQARDPADAVAESVRRNTYLIDLDNSRLRLESSTLFPGEVDVSVLLVLGREGGFSVDPAGWRAGTDVVRVPAEVSAANVAAGTRVLPHLLLMQALSYESTLTDDGIREVEVAGRGEGKGERYRIVGYRDVSGAAVGVYLDPDSHLVRGYEVRRGEALNQVIFSDYRVVRGLRVPHTSRMFIGGVQQEVLMLTQVRIAPDPDESAFVLPAGFSDPPPSAEPHAARLAEGTFLLEGMPNEYRSMFLDMGDHVVVVEAPLSRAYGEAALRIIGETLPGKPVRYVLVTHHHADHIGGLAPFVEHGATIVAGAGGEVAIRRQFAGIADRLKIETVSQPRSFTGGGRRIVAHRVSTAHADASLVFHLPASGILFQGDLLYVPHRGPVPAAFPSAEALATLIGEKRLHVQSIIGVHGRSASVHELQQAITMRRRAGAQRARSAPPVRAHGLLHG